ncbi:MAG: protease family protein [Euryarchaeota archaeon]|nr:protease family protein [Euryarchaeota archaeon]
MAMPEFPPSELETGKISLPDLGRVFNTPTDEKIGITKKIYHAGVPVIAITFAELLIFWGRLNEAVVIYTLLLLAFSFSAAVANQQEIRKINQAFLLLPIFRLVNLSIPIFLKVNLYSFVFIYASLAMSAIIATTHQNVVFETKKALLKRMWIYLPLSVLAALVFAEAEYLLIGARPLIPDISQTNLLELTVIMVFVVGLVEELIFRGILQTRLEEFMGSAAGILLVSLLFGIMHSGYGTPYEIGITFLLGCFLGYCFYKTRSLTLVIMINGLTNVFLFGIIPILGQGLGLRFT